MKKIMSSITGLSANLREQLEILLENSDDEIAEKAELRAILEEIKALFAENELQIAKDVIGSCMDKIDGLVSFSGTGESATFLKLCLLLEQFVESSLLGVSVTDQFFASFLQELKEEEFTEEKINYSLVKMLRMVYQKQILSLFRGEAETNVIIALRAVINDLLGELPQSFHNDWKALSFYVSKSLSLEEGLASNNGKRLLALMDQRLSSILQLKKSYPQALLPELVSAVRAMPRGVEWMDENIKNISTYITAGVYSRFANALKTPLIKLHESLEGYYIDPSKFELLDENIGFLNKLVPVFQLMGFIRLSQLCQFVITKLEEWSRERKTPTTIELYEVVNSIWVLESSVAKLWEVNDYETPVNVDEIGGWATRKSRHIAYVTFSQYFMGLREKVLSESIDYEQVKKDILRALLALSYLNIPDILQASLLRNLETAEVDKQALEEILLALSYTASRKASGDVIPITILESALDTFKDTYPSDADVEDDEFDFETEFEELDLSGINIDDFSLFDDVVDEKQNIAAAATTNEVDDAEEAMFNDLFNRVGLDENLSLNDELDQAFQSLSLDLDGDSSISSDIKITAEPIAKIRNNDDEENQLRNDNTASIEVALSDTGSNQAFDNLHAHINIPLPSDNSDGEFLNEVSFDEVDVNDAFEFEPVDASEVAEYSEQGIGNAEMKNASVNNAINESESKSTSKTSIEIDDMLFDALVDETGDLEDIVKENLNIEVYSEHNINELLRVAHTLKANTKIIGLDNLVENIITLESYLTSKSEYNKEFVNSANEAFGYVFAQIKVYLFDQMLKLSRQNAQKRN